LPLALCRLSNVWKKQGIIQSIRCIHRACCVGNCRSERDQLVRIENLPDLFLNLLKAHIGAALALQMVEEASQGHKLLLTVAVRTVVDLLLVLWGIQVLLERGAGAEFLVADCTFPPAVVSQSGVQGSVGGPGGAVCDLLVGDEAFWVALADDAVDCLAVEGASVGTGAGF
jgi:hypothetical protein